MEDQEMTYTIRTPDGVTDFFYADIMFDAYTDATNEYGPGVTIRPSFYKEWTCGSEELAKTKGGCYYDAYGTHQRIEGTN
jgi:hypothetical protein